MPLADVVVGRQPIVDRNLDLIGYELLFRPIDLAGERHLNGDEMTTEVLFSTMSLGVDRLVGDKLMFCNADRGVLTGDVPVLLPPAQTVIEVLETVQVDDEVLAGCERLAARGYRLALDDFSWFDGAERLLPLAWAVKLDVRALPTSDLIDLHRECSRYGALVLAEKVETEQEVAHYRGLGFDLFQGYALSRPARVTGRVLDSSQVSRMRLATTLLNDDLDFDELEQIARTDPGLVFQLLQMAAIGRLGENRRAVHSISDALVLLGTRRLKNWLSFLLLRSTVPGATGEMTDALVRAQMCEMLAAEHGEGESGMGFTAGLISSFAGLLGASGREIRDLLGLDDELYEAAFDHTSRLGQIVHDVIAYQADAAHGLISPVTPDEIDLVSWRAFDWAVHATGLLRAA